MPAPVPQQVRSARHTVLALAEDELTALVVTGADRVSWLNGLLTCDVAKAEQGTASYGLAVAQKGRIVADLFVLPERERVVLLVRRSAAETLGASFDQHLMMEDAEIHAAPDLRVLSLHGPRAEAVLGAMREVGAEGATSDLTGLGGALVFWPREKDAAVRGALGAALAREGGQEGDAAGWLALRLERALPQFGTDFDATTYPQEAGLEKSAVSFSKGCYLGQEVVCMLQMRGHVKRKLAPLVLEGEGVPSAGAPVVTAPGGPEVGKVTSAVFSPTLGKPIALAMVKYASADPGSALVVDGQKAAVVERPA